MENDVTDITDTAPADSVEVENVDGPETPEAAEPEAAEPEEAPKSKRGRKARSGFYTLEVGDSPAVVAGKLFGRRSRGRDLVRENPDVKWKPGVEIKVPS